MGKEFYFETDDRLGRDKYAAFLKTLFEHCDEYRREDSEGAYVVAIDSPWGSGKTRFAKMLRNYLEGREPTLVNGAVNQSVFPKPSEDRLFNVIYYNSWETDYWGDALEPLINSIFESQLLEIEGAEADNAKLKDAIVKILKGMGLALIKLALGDAASSVFQGAIDGLNDVPDDPLAALKTKASQYSEFKSALGSVIARTNKKLVIIVDELDRCRPTFAIETLEIVKHLFDVKGLMFVFALDIKQLSCAVEAVYGLGIDAPGYLCRFFDYLGKMPMNGTEFFIWQELYGMVPLQRFYKDGEFEEVLGDYFSRLQEKYSLSLRDISTIMATYRIMFQVFLNRYPDISAHQLYLHLLCIKYKNPSDYIKLCFCEFTEEEVNLKFKEYVSNTIETTQETARRMIHFTQNRAIGRLNYQTYNSEGGLIVDQRLFIDFYKTGEGNQEKLHYSLQNVGNTDFIFRDMDNLGQILYYQDLLKWGDIRYLTIGQYYYQQLEMFNFALPSKGSEA